MQRLLTFLILSSAACEQKPARPGGVDVPPLFPPQQARFEPGRGVVVTGKDSKIVGTMTVTNERTQKVVTQRVNNEPYEFVVPAEVGDVVSIGFELTANQAAGIMTAGQVKARMRVKADGSFESL